MSVTAQHGTDHTTDRQLRRCADRVVVPNMPSSILSLAQCRTPRKDCLFGPAVKLAAPLFFCSQVLGMMEGKAARRGHLC